MYRSAGVRFFVVGLLVLLMTIPLFLVGAVLDSRAHLSRSTTHEIGKDWGGRQTFSGPQLIVPVEGPVTRTETRSVIDPETGKTETESYQVTEIARVAPLFIQPEKLEIQMDTEIEERRRGIFSVPVYGVEAQVGFEYATETAGNFVEPDETALWDQAYVRFTISSNRALRGEAELLANETALKLEPSAGSERGAQVIAAVGDPRTQRSYALRLGFNGADTLFVTPSGRITRITINSDWPDPSFTGAYLPDASEITEDGFKATWTVPGLARPMPQISRQDLDPTARDRFAFGVRFYQANDFYQMAYRAARYGVLFIALTFVTVLLMERQDKKPAHPVQYIFIGLAQTVFVLLMVAYAEQIGFGPAYVMASVATIVLITLYGWNALDQGRRALLLGAVLLALYAVLYLILRSADYALLAGSTLAFCALAGTMWATRNENWYGAGPGAGAAGGLTGVWRKRPSAEGQDPKNPPGAPA
ncbi:MAG: cell envelope integrity protein CreD [Pseudomonadota bacterium]